MSGLKDFLLHYCVRLGLLNTPNTAFVVNKVAHTVVVLLKRGWLDLTPVERTVFFDHIIQLRSGDTISRQIGLRITFQLLAEFSTDMSTAVGLTWDFHQKCRQSFETVELRRVFEDALTWLSSYCDSINSARGVVKTNGEEDNAKLCLGIVNHVLMWEFTCFSSTMAGSFENITNSTANSSDDITSGTGKFPATWTNLLIRPQVIDLLFRVHDLLADMDETGISLKSLVSLASIKGPIFSDQRDQSVFTERFLGRLGELVGRLVTSPSFDPDSDDTGATLTGIADITKRLLSTHPLTLLAALPSFTPFMNQVCTITVNCLNHISQAGNDIANAGFDIGGTGGMLDTAGCSGETVDVLMDAWTLVAMEVEEIERAGLGSTHDAVTATHLNSLKTMLKHAAGALIFPAFIHAKMAMVSRRAMDLVVEVETGGGGGDGDEDDCGDANEDRFICEDQLLYLAVVGRLDAATALNVLARLLAERFERIKLVVSAASGAGVGDNTMEVERQVLFEQVHWLTSIAGFVVADLGLGEVPVVHIALSELSASSSEDTDLVIQLPHLIFNILSFLTVEPGSQVIFVISPLLVETLLWFVDHWSKTYLFAKVGDSGTLSLNIRKAFTEEGDADRILVFILDIASKNFELWSSDENVLAQIVCLLNTLASKGVIRNRLLRSERFQHIIQYFLNNISRLPPSLHSEIITLVATISTQGVEVQLEAQAFNGLVSTIQRRFHDVLNRPDFSVKFQQQEIKSEIINTLEMILGLAAAASYHNATVIFSSIIPYFEPMTKLFHVYASHFDLNVFIIDIYLQTAKILAFDELDGGSRRALSMSLINVLRIYTSSNQGIRGRQADLEDDLFKDLSLIMETLTILIHHGEKDKDLAEAVFFGINTVLPMVTREMLKFPRLCRDYLCLAGKLIEQHPEKLATLPASLVAALFSSIRFGSEQPMVQVRRTCFDSVTALVKYCFRERSSSGGDDSTRFLEPHLDASLDHIMDTILFKELDRGFIDIAGESLFSLIVLRHNYFLVLVSRVMSSQSDETKRSRLDAAFGRLNTVVEAAAVRVSSSSNGANAALMDNLTFRAFQDGLVEFLMDVRSFLRVK